MTFSNETATGWQTRDFATPVAVSAGPTYVVSYTAPQGHYAVQPDAFAARGVEAAPLEVDGGFGATPAGVYASAGRFPATAPTSANYYVDALFTATDDSPLIATNQWPLPASSRCRPDRQRPVSKPVDRDQGSP